MTTNGIYIYGIVPNFYGTDMFRSLETQGFIPSVFKIYLPLFPTGIVHTSIIMTGNPWDICWFNIRKQLKGLLIKDSQC